VAQGLTGEVVARERKGERSGVRASHRKGVDWRGVWMGLDLIGHYFSTTQQCFSVVIN
jgi:hypothetical protein